VVAYELGAAALDPNGEAAEAAVLTDARGRRQERRCSTRTGRRLRASCWAMNCEARRRTRQHDAAYRMEATVTSGRSYRNGSGAGQPVGDGQGERGGGDAHSVGEEVAR
jgi:hypothetical protein